MENLIHIQITALFGVIYIGGSQIKNGHEHFRWTNLKVRKLPTHIWSFCSPFH